MPSVVESKTLFYKAGASDKFYHTELYKVSDQEYYIFAFYGRRPMGSVTPNVSFRLKNHAPLTKPAAFLVYEDLLYSKTQHNYYESEVPPQTNLEYIHQKSKLIRNVWLNNVGIRTAAKSKDEKLMDKVILKEEPLRRIQI